MISNMIIFHKDPNTSSRYTLIASLLNSDITEVMVQKTTWTACVLLALCFPTLKSMLDTIDLGTRSP